MKSCKPCVNDCNHQICRNGVVRKIGKTCFIRPLECTWQRELPKKAKKPKIKKIGRTVLDDIEFNKTFKIEGLCQCCGLRDATEKHHLIPKSLAPLMRYNRLNLALLCTQCHRLIHDGHIKGWILPSYTTEQELIEWRKKWLSTI